MTQVLTVLTCVFNEAECLADFCARAKIVLNDMPENVIARVLFINNGSTDESLSIIQRQISEDPRFGVLSLARNFGYQGALVAGFSEIESDLYCAIDVDCEDPPELLPQFLDKIRQGAQIVYGIRSNRSEPRLLTYLRKQFYLLNKLVADSEVVVWMSEFAMITKEVRDSILKSRTTYPFLRTELGFVGFHRVGIDYKRQARIGGQSHYNALALIQFAIGGILAGTTLPLRLPLYLSPLFLAAFIAAIIHSPNLQYVANCAVILLFLYTLLTLPFVAVYLARTYKNGVERPLYVVDRTITKLWK